MTAALLARHLQQPISHDALHLLPSLGRRGGLYLSDLFLCASGFRLLGDNDVLVLDIILGFFVIFLSALSLLRCFFVVFFAAFFVVFVAPSAASKSSSNHCGPLMQVRCTSSRSITTSVASSHFERRIAQVDAGGLQSVEHESGGFVVHAPGAEHLDHFHQRHLHRVRVFQQRQIEPTLRRHIRRNFRLLPPDALMKKAMPPAPQRRRPTLRPVHLYVLTSWNIFEPHIFLTMKQGI